MKASPVIAHALAVLAVCAAASGQVLAQAPAAAPAAGPAAQSDCLPVSPTRQVVVDTSAGQSIRGTLMCLSDSGAWLLRDGRLSTIPLEGVRRIRTTADPVWDGAAKGAAIPLILWAVLCHECPAGPVLKASLAYGLVGLVIDGLDSHRQTLYQSGGRTVSVGWRVSF